MKAPKREIVVKISTGRLGPLLLLLVIIVFLAYHPESGAQGKATPAAPLAAIQGSYYLTTSYHYGGAALTACAPGYHMASLWEIQDTSNLDYDTSKGYVGADSGMGPPSGTPGWARTGLYLADGGGGPGISNCHAWTDSTDEYFGTLAYLNPDWDGASNAISPWAASDAVCNAPMIRVWCMRGPSQIFLPIVLVSH